MAHLSSKQINQLKLLDKNYIHGKNMLAKKDDSYINAFFMPYMKFLSTMMNSESESIKNLVDALNSYKDFVRKTNANNHYSAQSKFEPTILEEFICHVLKGKIGNDVLQYGSVKAYSSLYFSYTSKDSFKAGVDLKINQKDQDVGIFKSEVLHIGEIKKVIHIPLVCIECKTYLDKTMYEGSVATASKIKNGNPKCLFIIATETYDVSNDVDIETSLIDNIYVLRKQKRSKNRDKLLLAPINVSVIEHLVNTVSTRIDRTDKEVDQLVTELGYLRQ